MNGGSSYWERLSDEQLLTAKFTTDDPEALDGLVLEVPANAQDAPVVELSYDFRGSKREFIRCAHCGYPNHLAGIVIKTKDSKRFLVGHDCGEKIYGVTFEGLRREFTAAQDRASALRRYRNLLDALPAFCSWLTTLRRDPALRLYSAAKQDIRSNMQRLWWALEMASGQPDNILYIDERVRDLNAESRAQERYDRELEQWQNETVTQRKKLRSEGYREPEKPKYPMYTKLPKAIGVLPAVSFFRQGNSPAQDIGTIADTFVSLSREKPELSKEVVEKFYAYQGKRDARSGYARLALSVGGHRSTSELERLLKETNSLLDNLAEQIQRLSDFASLCQPEALTLIARWATERDFGGTYSADHRSLKFANANGSDATVTLPSGYVAPSPSPINEMRKAINRQ